MDTSSIIENKETTKEYWKQRMKAEQALIETSILRDSPAKFCDSHGDTSKATGKSSHINGNKSKGNGVKKLGSDGEGEDGSLSPISSESTENESSEEGSVGGSTVETSLNGRKSDNVQTSGDVSNSLVSLDEMKRKLDDKYLLNGVLSSSSSSSLILDSPSVFADDVFVTSTDHEQDINDEANLFPVIHANATASSQHVPIHHHLNHHILVFGDREREDYLLSTVIEEEQEQDSLEEFIKHEQQCQQVDLSANSLLDATDKLCEKKSDKVTCIDQSVRVTDAKASASSTEVREIKILPESDSSLDESSASSTAPNVSADEEKRKRNAHEKQSRVDENAQKVQQMQHLQVDDDHLRANDSNKKLSTNCTISRGGAEQVNSHGDSNHCTVSPHVSSVSTVDAATERAREEITSSTALTLAASLPKSSSLQCNKSIASSKNDLTTAKATVAAQVSTGSNMLHSQGIHAKPVSEQMSIDAVKSLSVASGSPSSALPVTGEDTHEASSAPFNLPVTSSDSKHQQPLVPVSTSKGVTGQSSVIKCPPCKKPPNSLSLRECLMSEIENHSGLSQLNRVNRSHSDNKMSSADDISSNNATNKRQQCPELEDVQIADKLITESSGPSNFLLMRSPLPDSDIVTSLTFESIEVPTDDGIDLNLSSPSSGPESPPIKDNKYRSSSEDAKGDSKHSESKSSVSSTLSSNGKCNKVLTSGSVKELIEKRKAANANSTLNTGLTNSKRSTSYKDLREKNEAEVKIAQEIIELRKREDELKQMRQERVKIHSSNSVSSSNSSSSSSTVGEKKSLSSNSSTISVTKTTSCSDVSSVDIETGRCSPSNSEISTTESVSGRISVDSFESNSSNTPIPCKLLHSSSKQSAASTIRSTKPYLPMDETMQVSTSQFTNESPIEKEIRLAKQREDELKRQRGQSSPDKVSNDPEIAANADSGDLGKRAPATASIQKVLATTRIQQEIEEQTQREIALKAVGSIKTISQERTDTKIVPTKLSSQFVPPVTGVTVEAGAANKEESPVASTLEAPVSPTVASTQVSVINSKATGVASTISKLPCPPATVANGTGKVHPPPVLANGQVSGAPVASLIPSVSAIKMGFVNQFTKNINGANSISMHRFISSKGKSTGPSNGSNLLSNRFASHQNLCFNSTTNDYTIQELKPPKVTKQFVAANTPRRGSLSTETKIQEELKEMEAREEELRHQRFLTRSQGNLNNLTNSEDDNSSAHDSDSGTEQVSHHSSCDGSKMVTRTKSIFNMSPRKNDEEEEEDESLLPKLLGRRIKNSLIAQWESKIQRELATGVNN